MGTSIVCENEIVHISCEANQTISVTSASYGRNSGTICPTTSGSSTRGCRAADSLTIVQDLCDGRQTCSVPARNNVFGDPCQNTYKYLYIEHCCLGMEDLITIVR